MARTPDVWKIVVLVFALIAISSFAASYAVNKSDSISKKVSDTPVRAELLALKKISRADYSRTQKNSSLYSNVLFDMTIDKGSLFQLPGADHMVPGIDGVFDLKWRIKLTYDALFSLSATDESSDFSVKMLNDEGLPVYTKTRSFTVPDETVRLKPGIYAIEFTAKFNFQPSSIAADTPDMDTIGSIHFTVDHRSFKDLKRLRTIALNSTKGNIVKMPNSRVNGALIDEKGRKMGDISIGLSGRTREHLGWFPSIDVNIQGGWSYKGIPEFKLYRLETKSGLNDIVFLSVLKDMGFPVPRQDVVRLVINGKEMGIYYLMETPSPTMFTNQRMLEGNILGVQPSKLFFDYPYGAELDLNYFHKVADPYYKKKNARFFLSEDFADSVDSDYFARYIAFASVYLGSHGMGVDDLRFYNNPATNRFVPIPRDMNPGAGAGGDSALVYLTNIPWGTNYPLFTVWPIRKTHAYNYEFSRKENIFAGDRTTTRQADLHFAISQFLSDTKNNALTNKYLKYFAEDIVLRMKIQRRLENAQMLLLINKDERYRDMFKQGGRVKMPGVPSISREVKRNILDSGLYLDDGRNTFFWNVRTSAAAEEGLIPGLIAPLALNDSEGLHDQGFRKLLARAFLCEKRIMDLLEKTGIGLPEKSFKQVGKRAAKDVISIRPQDIKGGPPTSGYYPPNMVVYLGTIPKDNDRVLLLFLVRNASEAASDYAISIRDSFSKIKPSLNETFHLVEGAHDEKASIKEILTNRLRAGEGMRLLAFDMSLANNAVFYRMSLPEDAYSWFPPYMYLPARSKAIEDSDKPIPGEFVKANNGYHLSEHSRVKIDGHLVFPQGANLYIHEGATLLMSPESSIKLTGSLYVLGTGKNRVKFVSDSGQPWEGLYVGGTGSKRSKVVLRSVDFDNFGTFPKTKVGDLSLNGGLSFYRTETDIEDVRVTNAKGEDAVNLISSIAVIKDLTIAGTQSDAIDLDFTDAIFEGLHIQNTGGDGIDVSASVVLCKNSVFEKTTDKGISVGEMSNIQVRNSVFRGNDMGIANKDQSRLEVTGSTFEGNRLAVAEFIKKPTFGRPNSALKDNSYRNNEEKYAWLGIFRY
jgi:hypothetical protein